MTRTRTLSSLRALVIVAALAGLSAAAACPPGPNAGTDTLTVASPDGSLTVSLSIASKPQPYLPGDRIYYRVAYKGTPVLEDSPLGLDFTDGPALDRDLKVVDVAKRSGDSTWENAFGARRKVRDRYNEIVVSLEEQIKLEMKQYSLGRPTEEYELGQTAVFLASDESSAITGQTVVAACGMNMWG
jgi:hypothetical protein